MIARRRFGTALGKAASCEANQLSSRGIFAQTFRANSRILMFLLAFGPALAQQEQTFSSRSNLVLVPTLVKDAMGNVVYATAS